MQFCQACAKCSRAGHSTTPRAGAHGENAAHGYAPGSAPGEGIARGGPAGQGPLGHARRGAHGANSGRHWQESCQCLIFTKTKIHKYPKISKTIKKNVENVQMQKCDFLHFFSKLSKNIQTYLKKLIFSLDATKTRRQENKPCPWGWKGRRPAHAGRAWFATTATISTTNRDGIYDKLRRQLLRITTTIYDNS